MCYCYQVKPPAFRKSALAQRWLESLKEDSQSVTGGKGLLVRPTVTAPVYTLEKECSGMRWGFERPWAGSINNARIEKRGTMLKKAWSQGRCLIPMSGWFEFSGPKGSMKCHLLEAEDEGPLLAAGLWETHEQLGDCFTMIMAESDPETLLGRIHHRMPVLLSEADGVRWMAQEPRDLAGSPGITVKETIVPSPLKKQKETVVQVNLL